MIRHFLVAMGASGILLLAVSQRLGSCFSSRVFCLATATLAAALMSGVASAAPIIPLPIYNGTLCTSINGCVQTSSVGSVGSIGGLINGTVIEVNPFTAVFASASCIGACFGLQELAEADAEYFFAVSGVPVGTPVPLKSYFQLSGSINAVEYLADPATGDIFFSANTAIANFIVCDDTVGGAQCASICGHTGTVGCTASLAQPSNLLSRGVTLPGAFLPASHSDQSIIVGNGLPLVLRAGDLGDVWLQVLASSLNGGSATAKVDPFIAIDPAFLQLYPSASLEFSQGVVNGLPPNPTVPEPATLALVGLGLAGLALRRRKRSN